MKFVCVWGCGWVAATNMRLPKEVAPTGESSATCSSVKFANISCKMQKTRKTEKGKKEIRERQASDGCIPHPPGTSLQNEQWNSVNHQLIYFIAATTEDYLISAVSGPLNDLRKTSCTTWSDARSREMHCRVTATFSANMQINQPVQQWKSARKLLHSILSDYGLVTSSTAQQALFTRNVTSNSLFAHKQKHSRRNARRSVTATSWYE